MKNQTNKGEGGKITQIDLDRRRPLPPLISGHSDTHQTPAQSFFFSCNPFNSLLIPCVQCSCLVIRTRLRSLADSSISTNLCGWVHSAQPPHHVLWSGLP